MPILVNMSETRMDKEAISGLPKALVKGVALVDIVASRPDSPSAAELVEASGLPRGTALRLLDALVDLGLLHLDPAGTYELGSHLAYWGNVYRTRLDLAAIADDVMNRLRETTRETVYLGIRDGEVVLYLGAALSPQAIRPAATVGARNPLHSTGIGRILLAAMPRAERDTFVDQLTLTARTPHTITDRDELKTHLDLVAERGFAIDDNEDQEGMRCVAAAIRDASGRGVAAMSVSAPSYRFSLDEAVALAPTVISAAAEISARLGYTR